MTSVMFCVFVVVSLVLGINGNEAEKLRAVFGSPRDAIGPAQVSAVTPANTANNGTLIDLDYWDSLVDYAPIDLDYDRFDWVITTRVATTIPDENFLLSPLGLKLALAILSEAATGVTQTEIVQVLGLESDREQQRRKFSNIVGSLRKQSPDYILNFGSRVYVGNNAYIRQRFAAIAQNFYDTEMKTADFSNPIVASREINDWVSHLTQGRIPNLVNSEDVKGLVVMILNTLYFKGTWLRQFATNETKQDIFYLTPTKTKLVPFMHVKDKFFYIDSAKLDAKIIRLPYLGNKFAMYIILPNALTGIPKILDQIHNLASELKKIEEYELDLFVPKFKFEFTSQLQELLRDLGIKRAFEDMASFPGIARGQPLDQRLKVSKVMQRSGIEVNENGSVAYSATEVGIVNKFGEGSEVPIEVVANRPFIFCIQDDSTKQLLFTGRVSDPLTTDGAFKPNIV